LVTIQIQYLMNGLELRVINVIKFIYIGFKKECLYYAYNIPIWTFM